jgi:hypothetical protein
MAAEPADYLRKQPGRRPRLLVAAVALLVAAALCAGFYLGQYVAYEGMGAKPKSYRAMQAQLLELRAALDERDTQLEIQGTRHEVDRHALELVRRDMAAQQEQISALEEGLAFYRSLISPEELGAGLGLRKLELLAGNAPGTYLFRIVVQQEARKHELLDGQLRVTLAGQLAGEPVEYSLEQLSDGLEGNSLPLSFRYFQAVEGTITLPEGFEPEFVTVVASTSEPHKLEVTKQYSWQLDERFTHVGK